MFNSFPVDKFSTTGGATVIGFLATGGSPYPCPVTTTVGASGDGFLYTVIILDPCFVMF